MLLSPQPGITYGPVRSRRLGQSLGVNILPARRKLCNFDCRYCQYGWSDPVAQGRAATPDLPAVGDILEAVASTLRSLPAPPDYVTFSGNGEPTLHPRFDEVVDGVNDLRARLAPRARTAILSNSSTAGDAGIRQALSHLDVRIMKLDVGTEAGFQSYNRPAGGLALEDIVEGLRMLPGTTLQTLLTTGIAGNLNDAEMDAWIERVAAIRPLAVQLYTLDREAPDRYLIPATREQLAGMRARVTALGVKAEVY
jgi:wyosine [tRNA(Phe)-imidazoG37] synthetase (radical SAM superfamily)